MIRSPKILVFAGANRSGTPAGKLAALAAKECAIAGAEVTHISLADYPLPIQDADRATDDAVPDNATRLARMIAAHHGVFVATPERNHAMAALLANALDWVSRVRHSGSIAYRNRVYLIGGTSDGSDGGVRAVLDLRKVLAAVGGIVLPGEIAIPRAQYAFDESGALVDEAAAAALGDLARQLIEFAGRLAD